MDYEGGSEDFLDGEKSHFYINTFGKGKGNRQSFIIYFIYISHKTSYPMEITQLANDV